MYKETLDLLIKYGEFFVFGELTESDNNSPSQIFRSNFNELKLALGISPNSAYKSTEVYTEFVSLVGSFIPSKKRLHLINQLFIKLEGDELDPFRGTGLTRYFLRYEVERNKKRDVEKLEHIPLEVKQHFNSIVEILRKLNKSTEHQLALKKSIQSILALILGISIKDAEAEEICAFAFSTNTNKNHQLRIEDADPINIERAKHKFSFLIKILSILEGINGQIQHALQGKEKNMARLNLGFFEKFDSNSLCEELDNLKQVVEKIKNNAAETMIKFNDGAMKLINMINEVDGYLDAIIEKIDSVVEEPVKNAAEASLAFLRMKRKEWFGENGTMLDPLLNPQAKFYPKSSQQPPKVSFSQDAEPADKITHYRKSLNKLLEELNNIANNIILGTDDEAETNNALAFSK